MRHGQATRVPREKSYTAPEKDYPSIHANLARPELPNRIARAHVIFTSRMYVPA